MSRTKFQHYVPRFYLENFSDLKGMIWVYDKKLDKAYCTKPENTGGETYFYDASEVDDVTGKDQYVEKFFGVQEGITAYVLGRWLRKLRSGEYFKIYPEERELFARFLALQLVRTPSHRSFALQMSAMMKKVEFKAFLKQRNSELADYPFELQVEKKHVPLLHALNILDSDSLEESVQILMNHIWAICPNGSQTPLYTSDSPFTRYSNLPLNGTRRRLSGIRSRGIDLSFPLSPSYSLHLMERDYFSAFKKFDGRIAPFPLAPENVEHENWLQIGTSNRFIFSINNDFTLVKEVCEKSPELRNPDRAQFATHNPLFQNEGNPQVAPQPPIPTFNNGF